MPHSSHQASTTHSTSGTADTSKRDLTPSAKKRRLSGLGQQRQKRQPSQVVLRLATKLVSPRILNIGRRSGEELILLAPAVVAGLEDYLRPSR